jgi:hypothetical protein
MSLYSTYLTAYRGYQDIGTVGQTTNQLAGNIQSINQILDVACCNTTDYLHSFVRVEHLVALNLASLINNNQLTSAGAGGSGGGGTYTGIDSVSVSGTSISLVNDTATPGDDMFYGTNGSGTRGWYALSSYSGTVTSVGLSDTSTTAIYSISGSPVTTSGTIDITLKTQSAATFLAGPATGSAAQPAFRDIQATDVPTLNQNTTGSSGSCTGNSATATSAGSCTGNSATATLLTGTTAVSELSKGAGWNSSSGAISTSVVSTTVDVLIPYACTLKEVDIITSGGTGSCTVDVWKAASLAVPASGNDITGGVPPAISSGTVYQNTTLSGWTTAFAQNDRVRFTLVSTSIFTEIVIVLRLI